MEIQGKIVKGPALDKEDNKSHGWKLVPHLAFKNTDPAILSQLKPLPQVQRESYKDYLKNNDI